MSKPEPFESNLPIPLSEFLAHVRVLSRHINKHAKQMSAASGGRVGAKTAQQLVELAQELEKIDSERPPAGVGSARALIREAMSLVTEIRMAARFIAPLRPQTVEQLSNLRRDAGGRSIAAVIWDLQMHIGLVEEHRKHLAGLLPKTIRRDCERLAKALQEHSDRGKRAREDASVVSQRRAAILTKLRALSSEARALAAILFRNQPEIARQFQMPKRRAQRARVSRAPATPAAT